MIRIAISIFQSLLKSKVPADNGIYLLDEDDQTLLDENDNPFNAEG